MSQFTERFVRLNKRARLLLAVGAAMALIVVVGGALLAGNPSLLARLTGDLPGRTLAGMSVETLTTTPWLLGRDENGKEVCLSATTEYLGQPGKYMVRPWTCDPNFPANFIWTFSGNENDGYRVATTAGGSQVCLDVEGDSTTAGATITTFPCDSSKANQSWYLVDESVLKSKLSGLCLAWVEDQNYMVQKDCSTDAWWFRMVTKPEPPEPTPTTPPFTLPPAGWGSRLYWVELGPQYCLSVTTEPIDEINGKYMVRLWECDTAKPLNQRWGAWYGVQFMGFTPYNQSICLDVEGASTNAEATVTSYKCTDKDNQKWEEVYVDEGFLGNSGYRLKNWNSGLCLTLQSGNDTHSYLVQRSCENSTVWQYQ